MLRVDADLRDAIPAEELALAERAIRAPGLQLPAGPWMPPDADPRTVVLVLQGLITSELELAGTRSAQLHGSGDVLLPWAASSDALPVSPAFNVRPGGATVVLLGEPFRRAQQRWPQLAARVQRRFAEQAIAMTLRAAIVSLPRVEQRILALFWQLAERWGTVHADGVRVPLKLTHDLIGRLAGAKRPTVSLALSLLAEQGALRPDGESGWWMSHDSVTTLCGAAPKDLTCRDARR